MTVVLHISDPHFGTEQLPVMRAVQQLAREQNPDLLILSGDITQRARRHQFRNAAAFVDSLQVPARVVIPGNHDVPLFNIVARLWFPFANFQRAFGAGLEPEFETDDLLVLSANSTRPELRKDGALDVAQLERVVNRLQAAAARQLRIVVMHHPVTAIDPSDQRNLVRDHNAVIRLWSDAGADLILGGHIHLPYVRPLRTAARKLARDTWAVQAGTAVSQRVRGAIPNSLNILRTSSVADRPTVSVERWDYDAAAAFTLIEATPITADRADA